MKLLLRTLLITSCLSFLLLPAYSDDRAICIKTMDNAIKKLNAANSFRADVVIVDANVRKVGFVEGLKPNYMRAELWTVPAGQKKIKQDESIPHEMWVSDGTNGWHIDNKGLVSRQDITKNSPNLCDDTIWTSDFYYYHYVAASDISKDAIFRIYKKERQGEEYSVIETCERSTHNKVYFFVGRDGLIHCYKGYENGALLMNDIPRIKLNINISPKDFVFHKPPFARAPKSKIDLKAKEILTKVEQTYRLLNAMDASVINIQHYESIKRHRVNYHRQETFVKMMKPNYISLDTYWEAFNKKAGKIVRHHNIQEVSNGDNLWRLWDFDNNYYEKTTCKKDGSNIIFFGGSDNLDLFYAGKKGYANTADDDPEIDEISYLGSGKWHGDLYEMISIKFNMSGQDSMYKNAKLTYVYYVGSDNIIHRSTHEYIVPGDTNMETDLYIEKLDLHPSLSKSDFVFTPPTGATEKIQFPDIQAKEKPLLSNGTVAPDFTVQDSNGKSLHLSDYKGRVVVLDFWSTWCGPCQQSLPSTNAVAKKYAKKNVVVIGVNVWDTKEAFDAWLPNHKNYDSIKFAIDPTKDSKDVASLLYNVSGIPTQYIIDKNGKIVKSIAGFSGTDEELAKGIETALKK